MLAGPGEPGREGGAEAGGFEARGGELVEGVPGEADPRLRGREGLAGGDAFDVQGEDQVELGLLLALLEEAVFAAAEEGAGLGGEAKLLQDLPFEGLARGLPEINMPAGQVGDAGLASETEQQLVLLHADAASNDFDLVFHGKTIA